MVNIFKNFFVPFAFLVVQFFFHKLTKYQSYGHFNVFTKFLTIFINIRIKTPTADTNDYSNS